MYKIFHRLISLVQPNLRTAALHSKVNVARRSASVCVQDRFVCLDLEDGNGQMVNHKYPSIWLRDNCQCPTCYHSPSKSRIINWQSTNINILPKRVKMDDMLRIVWSDNHTSEFELDWLQKRSFNSEFRVGYLNCVYRPKPRVWSKDEFHQVIEHFTYDDIVNNKEGLRCWLQSLAVNGCAMIHGAPHTDDACRRLTNLIGFMKQTHYGEEFVVRARATTNNAAYLATPLQMHTDLPYYEYKPGVSLLHCLVQSSSAGAANLLTDGFFIAQRFKNQQPDFYRILKQTLVNWSDYGVEEGNEFQKVLRASVIREDAEGNVDRINQSIPQRDSFFSIAPEQADEWYTAMLSFVQMLYDGSVTLKTKPGDILTFSNLRVLHGRTGYRDVEGNTRHLIGAFIDWDEIYSRLRVLSDQ